MSTPSVPPARFIAIEGIDGAGTTTQTERLAERLRAFGHRVHTTREPSEHPIGKLTRAFLSSGEAVDERAMALLFAADRLDHYAREIKPKLDAGIWVLSDRYVMSSLVYQGELLGEPAEGGFVRVINQHAHSTDLTLYIACSAHVAATRRQLRGGPDERYDDLALQLRLAARYEALALTLENCTKIDGEAEMDAVTDALLAAATP
jgi:dTMP kinase